VNFTRRHCLQASIIPVVFGVALALAVPMFGQNSSGQSIGLPQDWTHHHLIFPDTGTYQEAVQNGTADKWMALHKSIPFLLDWAKRKGAADPFAGVPAIAGAPVTTAGAELSSAFSLTFPPLSLVPERPKRKPAPPTMTRDWSVSLGGGGVAAGMYPAKFGYDVNANPTCSDFAVFPVNATPASGQANLVGLNNLYSASTGTNFCPGTGPTFLFAYEVGGSTGGAVKTSPVISLLGTKVAFVESLTGDGTSVGSKFHVLTIGTTGSNGSSATSPVVPGTGNNAVDTAITMNGFVSDTLSSPFVDYGDDFAYVGDNNGKLHKFTGVFLGSPAEVVGGSPSWPVAVAPAGTILTGPIYDSVSGNIFVGGSDGNLYAVNASTGTVRAAVISGRQSGSACVSLVDPPIVDSVNATIFTGANHSALSSTTCGGQGVLAQLDTAAGYAAPPAWVAGHAYAANTQITDSNGNIEKVTTAGTSGGSAPTWNKTVDIAPTGDTITVGITAIQTTITVGSTTGISANDYIQINSEIMQVTSVVPSTTLNVTRGQLGTTAVLHGISTPVSTYRLTIDNSVTWTDLGISQWVANTAYAFSTTPTLINDTNNNIEWLATPGTSTTGSHPTWSTTVGGVTTDNSAFWVNVGTNPLNVRATVTQSSVGASLARAGTFDNAYLTAGGKGGDLYYVMGGTSTLKSATFNGSSVMSAGSTSVGIGNGAGTQESPLTEIYNPNGPAGARDWLFLGSSASIAIGGCGAGAACVESYDITNSSSVAAGTGVAESGGTSGIIVDNVFSYPPWQASHPYTTNTLITDPNGNVQDVTACSGTCTSGSGAPTFGWNTTVDVASTTLTGSVTSGAGNMSVASTTGFSVGDYIKVDSEIMLLNAGLFGSGISRGQRGTTAASHNNGATVSTYRLTIDNTGANQVTWTNQGPNQTSSLYFGPLGAHTAVKLTQSGLK
jgi:hypothetical protein